MIQIKTPLRITLAGGGSDLPWWYKKNGGCVISASINKYIHIIGFKRGYDNKIWLSYSKKEVCINPNQVNNDIIRECLKKFKVKSSIEVHSISETPGKSGLGSSGAFTAALIKFLCEFKNIKITKKKIANLACDIEMKNLKRNSGKQDAFISVYGGIQEIKIDKKGEVTVNKLKISNDKLRKLNRSHLSYFTGQTRYSDTVLNSQKQNFKKENFKRKIMKKMVELTKDTKKYLISGNIKKLGEIFHKHWMYKKNLSSLMSNRKIDKIYSYAMKNGAYGGKLVGAGGGGFLIFIVDSKKKKLLKNKMKKFNLKEFIWDFDFKGIHKTKF